MENPFLKRATEQFRNEPEAFLGLVSPEPLTYFLGKPAKDGVLFDRLVLIEGTPGSGKTTLAQLFEYPMLTAMLRNRESFRELIDAMVSCNAIAYPDALVCASRLSLETDYRDLWEFDYPVEVKRGLMTTLIQARCVLSWLRNLQSSGIAPERIKIVPRDEAAPAIDSMGGLGCELVANHARSVERAIYEVVAALIPPSVERLEGIITTAYRPFDVIDRIRIEATAADIEAIELQPLVILDDAHLLHPEQFEALRHWLVRRELRVARWVMTRLDVLKPSQALAVITEDRSDLLELPGITKNRDTFEIMLQGGTDGQERVRRRKEFRRMAGDMASRYLAHMPMFRERNLRDLSHMLSTATPPVMSSSNIGELKSLIKATQKRLGLSRAVVEHLATEAEAPRSDNDVLPEDVRLQVLNILLNRAASKSRQATLFDQQDGIPAVTEKMPKVDSDIVTAACLALHHKYKRPYYYGMNVLCDAGSENAEQFLHLAAELVDAVGVQLIRRKGGSLDPSMQDRLLRQRAEAIIRDWDYPQHDSVRKLIHGIAEACVKQTLSENAWNAPGPNAFGILQSEFDSVCTSYPVLARVLQFGVAYNALRLVPRYSCKNKEWCLLELGGLSILKYGLSFRRGCFVEGAIDSLAAVVGAETI